jgi:hypothetical protein
MRVQHAQPRLQFAKGAITVRMELAFVSSVMQDITVRLDLQPSLAVLKVLIVLKSRQSVPHVLLAIIVPLYQPYLLSVRRALTVNQGRVSVQIAK